MLAAFAGPRLDAAEVEVKLKNKMVLRGVATPLKSMIIDQKPKKEDPDAIEIFPILMLTTPLERYFFPVRQQDEVNKDVDLSKLEGFKLPQTKQKGGGRQIAAIHGYVEKPGPFTSTGRRKLKIELANGIEEVEQAVTLITPQYLLIIALNFKWETAIATSSVPLDALDAMLRTASPADTAESRLRIARFYIQAGIYHMAERELEILRKRFPKAAVDVNKVMAALTQARAQEILSELKLRREAGQHLFVYTASKSFPAENVQPNVLREVRDLTADYEQAREKGEQIIAQLGELQGQLKKDVRVKEIAPVRAEIAEKLNYSTLDRLDAFSKLGGDAQLKPDEKLALALSGWVVGSDNAVTELDQALRLWHANLLVLDYLRSAPDADSERKSILGKLEVLEGAGPERVAQMIPLLPPVLDPAVFDPTGAEPGKTVRIEVPAEKSGASAAYWVSLPLEYHADHTYPAIVALHSEEGGVMQEVEGFWSGSGERIGQSQRRGYIVIAPEYVGKDPKGRFDYGAESHRIVQAALEDARRRFSVDSDRVFLAGHSMGADAAWDIALSHPHLFAGLVSISGVVDRHAKFYLENGRSLPLFAVAGELDRDLFSRNALSFMKMMQQNFDFIYNEYKGSGPEAFYSKIHTLFEWMALQRRRPPPKEISARTLRETDNRFYWLEFADQKRLKDVDWSREKQGGVKPVLVTANISPGNIVHIKSGAAHYRLWLPRGEGLIDFEKKLRVEINGTKRFNDFIKPDLGAMLEHLRLTGDRQQIYWGMLEF
jgi:pimeloyl-ACP methyl ester carboxylesterase